MTTVAARFGVSANYLARVCDHLKVTHPTRGYWARISVGKVSKRSPLPVARPGEVLQWTKDQGVPRARHSTTGTIQDHLKRHEGTSPATFRRSYMRSRPP